MQKIPKEKYSNYENTITILENKDYNNFKRFIKEVHTIKSEYSLYDVRIGFFCLNFETEERDFYPVHRRISFMIDEDENYFPKLSTNNEAEGDENDIIHYKYTFNCSYNLYFLSLENNIRKNKKNIFLIITLIC